MDRTSDFGSAGWGFESLRNHNPLFWQTPMNRYWRVNTILRYCFLSVFLLIPLWILLPLWGFTQGEIVSDVNYFEGAMHFKFSITGKNATQIKETNSIDLMTMFLKDGDFIIQLYAVPESPKPFDPENPKIEIPKVVLPTTRLYIADSDKTYLIDEANKRYFLNDGYKPDTSKSVAVATGDSVKILSNWCYEYKAKKGNETVWFYITQKYRVNTGFFRDKQNCNANFLVPGLKGCIPLKIVRRSKDRTIEVHATKIIPQKFQTEQFRIPEKFKKQKFDTRR